MKYKKNYKFSLISLFSFFLIHHLPLIISPAHAEINLSSWKLTLPVDENGGFSGDAHEIQPSNLQNYSNPPYFYRTSSGLLVFSAPTDGATTSGSKYPRSELRQMEGDNDESAWSVEQGGLLEARVEVNKVPRRDDGKDGRVIVGQIHGKDNELCRLYYDRGVMYFKDDKFGPSGNESETQFDLKSDRGEKTSIPLNEPFSYRIDVNRNRMIVTVEHNGVTYSATDPISDFWKGKKDLYFKAGIYLGVSKPGSGAGVTGTGEGKVTFHELTLNGDNPPPPPPPPPPPGTIQPVDVTASTHDGNVPANTIDDDLSTRWSGKGLGESITFDLGDQYKVTDMEIAWYKGNRRTSTYEAVISSNGQNWQQLVPRTETSERTTDFQPAPVREKTGRFLRIIGYGNSSNKWNSITEVRLYGERNNDDGPPTGTILDIRAVTANTHDGNVPENAADGNTSTRWSGKGVGAWIAFDLGRVRDVEKMRIYWYNGHRRMAGFHLSISQDGQNWAPLAPPQSSSGQTKGFEEVKNLTPQSGRFVLLTGYGNNRNKWNSILEVELEGR